MYRVYAADRDQRINVGIRRRLAPLLGNDRRRIELLNGLLFSLPGTPVLYYGDEIGMGDNFYLGDRNGVRTPMQWSADKNAGFSRANPHRLYLPVILDPEYHYEAVNVEAQQANPHSLLWWTRRMIALRKRHPAFSRGTIEFLHPENHRVLAFLRRHGDETLLVVANLSRFAQYAALDLAAYAGLTPLELFGRSPFPKIGTDGYGLALGPHSFLWFSLVPDPARFGRARQRAAGGAVTKAPVPVLAVEGPMEAPWSCLEGKGRRELEAALLDVLPSRRWFAGAAGALRSVEITEAIPIGAAAVLALLEVSYVEAEAETYALPLAFVPDADLKVVRRLRRAGSPPVVARLESDVPEGTGLLYDPTGEPGFSSVLLEATASGKRFQGWRRELVATAFPAFVEIRGEGTLAPSPLRAGDDSAPVRFGDRLVLKLRPQAGGGRRSGPGDQPFPDRADRLRPCAAGGRFAGDPGAAERAGDPRHPAGVRAERGGCLELHARRPGTLLRPCARRLGARRSGSGARSRRALGGARGAPDPRRRLRAHRHLSADGPAARRAYRRAARRVVLGPREGFRARALLGALSAVAVRFDALADQKELPAPAAEPAEPAAAGARHGRAGAGGRRPDRRAVPPADGAKAHRPADPHPWRLSSGQAALHRPGLRGPRLRGRAVRARFPSGA